MRWYLAQLSVKDGKYAIYGQDQKFVALDLRGTDSNPFRFAWNFSEPDKKPISRLWIRLSLAARKNRASYIRTVRARIRYLESLRRGMPDDSYNRFL